MSDVLEGQMKYRPIDQMVSLYIIRYPVLSQSVSVVELVQHVF